jgi:hypothetical protein
MRPAVLVTGLLPPRSVVYLGAVGRTDLEGLMDPVGRTGPGRVGGRRSG